MVFGTFNSKYGFIFTLATIFGLSACGGGSQSSTPLPPKIPPTYNIIGAAVKGPLKFATVKIYQFDNTKIDGVGRLISTGTTDESAKIKDLIINEDISGYFVIEFSSNDATIEITTEKPPIFKYLRNIISASDIITQKSLYATPLSTLILKLAIAKLQTESSVSNALSAAQTDIKSVFGLGSGNETDLLTTPPMLTTETNSIETQNDAWSTRIANEASAALIYQLFIKINDQTLTLDELLNDIIKDLADGSINAIAEGLTLAYTSEDISVLSQPINSLMLAGSDSISITSLKEIMTSEISSTGYSTVEPTLLENSDLFVPHQTLILTVDIDQDGISNSEDLDNDNDGYEDNFDAFPLDKSEWNDNDFDSIGDNADLDDDNDGVSDDLDALPFDESESEDFDGDGIGNNADTDDDNDGITDELDAFPFNNEETEDFDGDGIGNNADKDDDNDSVLDVDDMFPLDAIEWADNDLDGIGNNTDTDDDNDDVIDEQDAFPFDDKETEDFDGDSIGNNADTDDDNDGALDINDEFPFDADEQTDNDKDGIGDNRDLDDDNDGFVDTVDTFPFDNNEWVDTDKDGKGNNFDSDDDNDGVLDNEDDLPLNASESRDFDSDGLGDNADPDDDNDGILDVLDNMTLGGQKTLYPTAGQITIDVRVKDNNNTILKSSDGWQVQYYTFDLSNSVNTDPESANTPEQYITKYTQDGYYNANYNNQTGEWLVQFPALDYAGTFKTRISVFCSRADNMCGGQLRSFTDTWSQEVSYIVTCASGGTCDYIPDAEPGVNVTDNDTAADVYSLVYRRNGQLITSYRLFSPNETFNALSNSNDFGASWQIASNMKFFSGNTYAHLYEDSKNNLLMVSQCALDLCIVKFAQDMSWSVVSIINMSEYVTCDGLGCSISIDTGSIIESFNGNYLLSYSLSTGGSSLTDVYVIKSDNLVNWSEPYKVSGYDNFDLDSKLIQLADGRFLMAYLSNDNNAIIITLSDDGNTWVESQKIPVGSPTLSVHISLLLDDDTVRIFYSDNNTLYSRHLDENTQFTEPLFLRNNAQFGPVVVKLPNDTFGIVYSLDLNEKRDIFFENIGAIKE